MTNLARPVAGATTTETTRGDCNAESSNGNHFVSSEGSSPSPSTDGRKCQTTIAEDARDEGQVDASVSERSPRPESSVSIDLAISAVLREMATYTSKPDSVDIPGIVDCPHLWMLNCHLVIRGMVVTGREATELPWRRKKDNEPASQAEIGREIELVKALAIRGKVQLPSDFASTKLYLREDVK